MANSGNKIINKQYKVKKSPNKGYINTTFIQ